MADANVGLQLIVYGRRGGQDLAGVLREVKEAGYAGIEAGNLFARHGEAAVRDLLSETGLKIAGAHSGYGDTSDPAKVEANIAFLKAVGAQYLINSGVASRDSIQGYEDAAAVFNEVGQTCRDNGIMFCYHNHNWEFEAYDGVKGIHRLCELTDPDLMKLCVDVYWVHVGGEDPAEFIQRYADRAVYYHFKDGAPGSFIELGDGEVDLPKALQAALACNPEWIVCEQDRTELEPKASITKSREYLRSIGL